MKFKVERTIALYVTAENAHEATLQANTVPVELWWNTEQRSDESGYSGDPGYRHASLVRHHEKLVEQHFHGPSSPEQ